MDSNTGSERKQNIIQTGPQDYKTFSMLNSAEHEINPADKYIILLINVKMTTIVGILTFISMINITSERLKARNFFICIYHADNSHEQTKGKQMYFSQVVQALSILEGSMCGSRGGGQGSGPPLKNHKHIGFLSNAGPDLLKITKLPSQHSMLGHHQHSSDGPLIVVN